MSDNVIEIESLDMEARGVGHLHNEDGSTGKVIFVEGALPGERVVFHSFRRKSRWEAATLVEVLHESSLRVTPRCPHFGVCGGCAMQHLEPTAQVAAKQRVLEDNLAHIGRVKPDIVLRPIHGPTWGYRYRARLSVRHVRKKGGVLVGFHERKSGFVADIRSCDILPPHVSDILMPLRALIESLDIIDQAAQIELAVGEDIGTTVTALVLRNLVPLSAGDEEKLRAFAGQYRVQWWLQPAGPDSAFQFYPTDKPLHYALPEYGIRMPFKPTDFTQVNHQINRVLVSRAMRLLDPQPHERIADLFCGLGNFTLPIATLAGAVVGIEGSKSLTTRAVDNARANRLQAKTSFITRNLFTLVATDIIELGRFDRMLVDPPRDGAVALCQSLADLKQTRPDMLPQRIVYVSCSPSTLARDAGLLVHGAGYVLKQAGVINMFPHTAHVESIAVFDLAESGPVEA
jgi:23S rRNA (uracil1939-C5)-methyltransferase